MTNRSSLLARGFARLIVALYPRETREQFGRDMMADFLDTLASRRTPWDRARFLGAAVVDAVRSAAAEHADVRDAYEPTFQPPRRNFMYGLPEDIRFGFRALRNRPGFVAAVVLTLALGIGANTAVFSLIDAIFLRPVAVADPNAVVEIFQAVTSKQLTGSTSYPVYRGIRAESHTLAGVAAAMSHQMSLTGPAGIELLNSTVVSGNYFDVLGVKPFIGRLIGDADDGAHGASPVIAISYRTWQRWFGSDQQVVGKTVTIADRPFTIIGVAPATFRGTELADVPDVWAPVSMLTSLGFGTFYSPMMEEEIFRTHELNWVGLVGRMRPGVTRETVAAELNQIVSHIPHERHLFDVDEPPMKSPMSVMPIAQSAALRDRDALVRFVRLVLGVVVVTLLLACANVANLLLVRSSERAQELGIRAALGAGRSRIVRQLFIESAMLAAAGAIVGLAVAAGTVKALSAFTLPGSIALAQLDLALDARLLAFTAAVAAGTALVFGLLPAIRASRLDLAAFLRNERASRSGGALRNTLVAAQVALALTLLIGATLFARSLRAGLTTDLGFDPHPLAAVSVDLRLHGYQSPQILEYYRNAEERLRARPEIQHVAIATHVPLGRVLAPPFTSSEATTLAGSGKVKLAMNAVSDDYFQTIGLPVKIGRGFHREPPGEAGRVAIVNEAAARTFWGADNGIGRTVTRFDGAEFTVIGVVKTTKYESVQDADVPAVYIPLEQGVAFGGVSVVARGEKPAAALRAVQQELASIDRNVTLKKARLVGDQIDDVLMPQRFGTRLFAIFSLIALVIASIGVHGVVAYGVSLRRRELGIRIALGALAPHIYWTVLRGSLIAVGVGGVIGLAAGVAGSPALAVFLYGIRPLDAAAFAGASIALGIAAVGASLLPAHRATRTDPVSSMRTE